MDRRVFLALVLFALVIIVPSLIWPSKPPARRLDGQTDSLSRSVVGLDSARVDSSRAGALPQALARARLRALIRTGPTPSPLATRTI